MQQKYIPTTFSPSEQPSAKLFPEKTKTDNIRKRIFDKFAWIKTKYWIFLTFENRS
jgi:hypothetical protein